MLHVTKEVLHHVILENEIQRKLWPDIAEYISV